MSDVGPLPERPVPAPVTDVPVVPELPYVVSRVAVAILTARHKLGHKVRRVDARITFNSSLIRSAERTNPSALT